MTLNPWPVDEDGKEIGLNSVYRGPHPDIESVSRVAGANRLQQGPGRPRLGDKHLSRAVSEPLNRRRWILGVGG